MTYTEKELDQFLHGISLSLLSKKSAQHWRYDEETAKEIEWLEALERKVRADKADRKTENSSEKPNNCEDLQDWKDRMWAEAIVTEPTISKMEQVEEPMKTTDYCDICKRDMCEDCVADATNPYCVPSLYEINYEPKDEPQTDDLQDWKDRMWAEAVKEEPQTGEMMTEEEFDSMLARALVGQTDCGWK